MADYPLWAAQKAIREGLSATSALRQYRAAGGTVRTQTWYRLFGQARMATAMIGAELDRDHESYPAAPEIQQRSTVRARGYMQQVNIFMRDQETGTIVSKPYSIISKGLLRRSEAIDAAVSHYADFADQYGLTPLGGLYTGTYELTPEDL